MKSIPRRDFVRQLAALPVSLCAGGLISQDVGKVAPAKPAQENAQKINAQFLTLPKTDAQFLALPQIRQLNVVIQGLAIIRVNSDPSLDIFFPNVQSSAAVDGHVYLAGNFLGGTDDDLTDCDPLVSGQTYSLAGINGSGAVPTFASATDLVFSMRQFKITGVDPNNNSFCSLHLPYPLSAQTFSYRIASRKDGFNFVRGTAAPASSLTLALAHIFSYSVTDFAHLRLSSKMGEFNWMPRRKATNPGSFAVNLLFYAEPMGASTGDHAAAAFELLTDLLPVQPSGKLDVHFDSVDFTNISAPLPSVVPENINPATDLESLAERPVAALTPANCVQVIINS